MQRDFFSQEEPHIFKPLYDSLLWHDNYMVLADFADYLFTQDKVSEEFKDQKIWTKKSIINTANSGKFSSDRTIKEYCDDIWKVNYKGK